MDSVLDFLFLRRLKFEYTCPPICPVALASSSGSGITGQVISPILAMNAPSVSGRFLTWPCDAGEVCFNIYFNNSGLLTEVATCIQPNTVLVCSSGCWQAAAVISGVEGPLTAPICTDGSQPVAVPLPAAAGVQTYHLYKDSVLVLAGEFCAAYETCVLGCYSVSAITGDGETPPSLPACNGGDPTTSITSPANGDNLSFSPSTVSASTVLNGHTPVSVSFYDDAILIGTVSGPGPYSVSWTPTIAGTRTLTAVLKYDSALTVTSAPVTVTISAIPMTDLLQWLESDQFDAALPGSSILQWTDLSGNNNHMTHIAGPGGISGADLAPIVDLTSTAGGHATVRFGDAGGNNCLTCPVFIPASGLTGLEIIVIFKNDSEPQSRGSVFSYTRTRNIFLGSPFFIWASEVPNQPVGATLAGVGTPGNIEEPFANGTDQTLVTGNLSLGASPGTTSFFAYNLSAAADGSSYKAWKNSNNFFSVGAGGYTFLSRGTLELIYSLGGAVVYGLGGAFTYSTCNIAAVMLWGRQLTNSERLSVRAYLGTKYGIAF